MRFQTRFDRWLVLLMIPAAIISCGAPLAIALSTQGFLPGTLLFALVPSLLWIIVFFCTLPQYYEVRDDGLFLRQGWRKRLIPYAALIEVQSISDTRNAGVFSTHRILLVTVDSKRFLIAVAEEDRFLSEVSRRCPQLEQRPFGLGTPLAPSSIA